MRRGRRVRAAVSPPRPSVSVLRLRVRRGRAGPATTARNSFVFRQATSGATALSLRRLAVVAGGASTAKASRSRLLVSGGRYRYISGALGDATVTGTEGRDPAAAGLAVQARPSRGQGLCRARHLARHRQRPTIRRTACMGRASARAARSICGSSPRPRPCSPPTLRSTRSSPAIRRASPMAGGCIDWFYLGPEAQTFACDGYGQIRFGVHLTGLQDRRLPNGRRRPAGRTDSDRRASPYRAHRRVDAPVNISRACGGSASPRSSWRSASARTAPTAS